MKVSPVRGPHVAPKLPHRVGVATPDFDGTILPSSQNNNVSSYELTPVSMVSTHYVKGRTTKVGRSARSNIRYDEVPIFGAIRRDNSPLK
jgi:hypothetical protein